MPRRRASTCQAHSGRPAEAGRNQAPAYGLGGTSDCHRCRRRPRQGRSTNSPRKIPIHAESAAALSTKSAAHLPDDRDAAYGAAARDGGTCQRRPRPRRRGVAIGSTLAFGGAAPLHAARLLKARYRPCHRAEGAGVARRSDLRARAADLRSRYMRLDRFFDERGQRAADAMSAEASELPSAAGDRPLSETRAAHALYGLGARDRRRAARPRDHSGRCCHHPRGVRDRVPRRPFNVTSPSRCRDHEPSVAVSTASVARVALPAVGKAIPVGSTARRKIYDSRLGRVVDAAVFERAALKPGDRLAGPAIVLEEGTSTFVTSSFDAHIDAGSALVLTLKEFA